MNYFREQEHQFIQYLKNDLKLQPDLILKIVQKARLHYFDPNASIAFIYDIDFVKYIDDTLTDSQCLEVLERLFDSDRQDDDYVEEVMYQISVIKNKAKGTIMFT